MKSVVFTFGRMNPPTRGHGVLVSHVKELAEKIGADARVYLSHSQDRKKNPLPYADKYEFAREAFGDVVVRSDLRNIVDIMKEIAASYDAAVMVVVDERVEDFRKMMESTNGKDYSIASVSVVGIPRHDGVSATKAREAAKRCDVLEFMEYLPDGLRQRGEYILDMTRMGMLR